MLLPRPASVMRFGPRKGAWAGGAGRVSQAVRWGRRALAVLLFPLEARARELSRCGEAAQPALLCVFADGLFLSRNHLFSARSEVGETLRPCEEQDAVAGPAVPPWTPRLRRTWWETLSVSWYSQDAFSALLLGERVTPGCAVDLGLGTQPDARCGPSGRFPHTVAAGSPSLWCRASLVFLQRRTAWFLLGRQPWLLLLWLCAVC